MTWILNAGLAISSLMTTIESNLTANGWTLTDRSSDGVFDSVNNQGVHQYVQITNCQNSGAAADATHNQYLQFQGWQSWNSGTHAGTNGSGTTYNRLYYAGANVADTTLVDMYMSVTANRLIIFIQALTTNYRNWIYFGGLDSLGGTDDPYCAVITGYVQFNTTRGGMVLQPSIGGSSFWTNIDALLPWAATTNNADALIVPSTLAANFSANQLGYDPTQILLYPITIQDSSPNFIRGNMDGLLLCPLGLAAVCHLDTVTVGATTYMIICPGGAGAASTAHPFTGNYSAYSGLAIVEA